MDRLRSSYTGPDSKVRREALGASPLPFPDRRGRAFRCPHLQCYRRRRRAPPGRARSRRTHQGCVPIRHSSSSSIIPNGSEDLEFKLKKFKFGHKKVELFLYFYHYCVLSNNLFVLVIFLNENSIHSFFLGLIHTFQFWIYTNKILHL